MAEVILPSKGQIVLPGNLRVALDLREGDRLRVILEEDNIKNRPIQFSASADWRQWLTCLRGSKVLQDPMTKHADERKTT